MKNINTIIILLIAVVLGSCSKSYLDTKPASSTSKTIMFETTSNVEFAINGIAKLMTKQLLETQGFNGEGTIKMYYGNYPGNNFFVNLPSWAKLINSEYNDAIDSQYCYYPWYYYYMLIGNANKVICNVDKAKGPEREKQYLKAQALSFRAYAYTMLAQLYCNRWSDSNNGTSAGLVLRLDESTGDLPLSTLAKTYSCIYTDLDDAIRLFTESGYKRDDQKAFFRPNINVAYAIYARAALARQDYPKAAEMAPKAYNGYKLMGVTDYLAGFCNPTSEWIWGSWGASDETLFFYSFQSYIAYNSSASAVRSYPKCISKELFNKIPATDIRRGLFLDPKKMSYTKSTGKAGSDLTKEAQKLFPDINPKSNIYAYMQFKIKANDMPGVGHLNHFRSSEMYLIEAEAKYFLKDEEGAIKVLEALNKGTERNPSYTCTKKGVDLLNEIKLYRTIELWGEGFDWFDMKRWGDTMVRKNPDNGGNFITDLAITLTPDQSNKWTWKIPNKETNYNGGIQ
jgi:starch-binding outer membrane protein, SusD/RagB family